MSKPFILWILTSVIFSYSQAQNPASTFNRDIPSSNSRILKDQFLRLMVARDSLKLDTLENGYDSIQFRFWITYPHKSVYKILSLKNKNKNWIAEFCEIHTGFNKNGDSIKFYMKNCLMLYPKDSWDILISKIDNMGVRDLPDFRKLNNYPLSFDGGNSITVEISTLRKYRLYFYPNPVTYQSVIKEAKNINDIVEYLSTQFNVDLF